nr:phosphatase PAP2 family protein [Corynebacterium sp. TAE3-ERU12]
MPAIATPATAAPVDDLFDFLSVPGTSENTRPAPEAPEPESYKPTDIARPYPSDVHGDDIFYFDVVSPFEDLRENHPEIMEQNLDIVVAINNAAKNDRDMQLRALADDHDDPLLTLADAFGEDLGADFVAALEAGRLPKTEALLSGNLARAGGLVSSTFAEKYYYGYDRPFVVAPDRIERYYRNAEGDDDPYSTTPSYPSGHTNKATWTVTVLSMMMPEFGPQLQARGAEAGYNRQVMGVHYPLDVMGGRMMGTAAAADRWNDPEFRVLIDEASHEIRAELEYQCGDYLDVCIANDTPYLSDAEAVRSYTDRMTYGFPQIGQPGVPVTVPAGYEGLLETRFPELTDAQRVEVLARTAIDSGYPLDRTDGKASHMRINLARALAAEVTVNADGSLSIVG